MSEKVFMLDSILGLGRGTDIYITVSQSCGLEMMELDKAGNIKSYAQTSLPYNEAQREIADYNEFKYALERVFQIRNINPQKANIHLSLPTVWFGVREGLPLLLDDSAITNVVLGELEQTYIFKRKDPLPFWFDSLVSTNSDSRNIFYSAVQKDAIEQIREIITGMGAHLVSVNCSLFADLNALAYTGIASNQMQEGQSWSLMIINNSGFQLFGMQANKILEYYEEPLPIKSYEGEEIYSAIENAAQIALMSTPSNSLLIISESDLVSAEVLAGRLQFSGETIFIEDNQFRKEPLTDMSLNILQEDQVKVSLHMIGSIAPAGLLPVNVDFLSEGSKKVVQEAVIEIPLTKDKVITLTPKLATIYTLILLVALSIPLGITWQIFSMKYHKAQNEVAELDSKIEDLDNQIKQYESKGQSTTFDAVAEIERVLKNNRAKIMAYAALGESVPKNLYLTYFMTGSDGVIDIQGCADSVEDVYVFFKNLKDLLIESKLKLSKLDLKSDSLDTVISNTASTIDTAPYVFEITNMDDNQMKSFMDKLAGKEPTKTETAPENEPANDPSAKQQAPNNGADGGLAAKFKQAQPNTDVEE
jgi:hypothetical protein